MKFFLRTKHEVATISLCIWGVLFIISNLSLQADSTIEPYEIFLTNKTSWPVDISVEPIGMIFNDLKEYAVLSSATHNDLQARNKPITGLSITIPVDDPPNPPYVPKNVVNHIATSTPSNLNPNRHIGYGKYRITIAIDQQNFNFSFDVDFSDADYPDNYSSLGLDRDIFLDVRPSPLRVFWISGITPSNEYQLVNGDLIQLWDQRRINGSNAIKTQNKGNFTIPTGTNIPLDGTDGVVTHITPGTLYVNPTVQGNVTVTSGKTVALSSGSGMILNPGVTVSVNGTLSIAANTTITGGGTIVKQGSGAILVTNSADATAFNNSRKLARDANSNYHLVFESEGEICYEKFINSGTALSEFRRLSSGNGNNKYPCIAERGGNLFVVWQRYDGSSYDIHFRKSTNGGSTWANSTELASNVGTNAPLPVIISPATDKLTVVYRTSSNLSYKVSNDSGTNWTTGAVPSTGANDNSPTLAPTTTYWGSGTRSCLVYVNTSPAIYYRYYRNGPDSTEGWNSTAKNLSQIVPGTYNSHQKSSIAPSGSSGDKRLHAVWEARSGTSGNYYVIIHRKATNWYDWPNVYSATYYEEQQQPSVTGLHDDTAELLFRMVSLNYVYKMHYDGSLWGAPVFVDTGTNPSVSVGNTTAKYVWTQGSAAPYQIKTSTETLSKTSVAPLAVAYHRSIAVLDPDNGAWLEVRLDRLSVKTKTSDELGIPFVTAKEDSLTLTPVNAFTNLASTLVSLPADAESLSVSCMISGKGLTAIKNLSSLIGVEFVLTGQNGAIIKMPAVNTASENLPETKFSLSTGIAAFAGGTLNLRTEVDGIAQQKSSLIASLGHIYEIVTTPLPKILATKANDAAPQDFALTAYPNPFNPSTQIRFVMKHDGVATLRVYNVQGQRIRELLHEYRAAGEHKVPWDGQDDRSVTVASGVYFIRFEAGQEVKISKVMLVR